MNILLWKFNNNDLNLNLIINYYQDYFSFEKKNNDTYLYLDSKILKKYLKKGLEIKYRKYIFLFLKSIKNINNIHYKLLDTVDKIIIEKNIYHYNCDLINNFDIDNLEIIINLSNKIILNKNKFSLTNNNIIKLDHNFYADINLSRFLFSKKDTIYKFNGIIINYNNKLKNKSLSILSILYKNNKYSNDLFNKEKIKINTRCTLILSNNNDIIIWKNIINKYFINNKTYIINFKKDIKNIKNIFILDLDFLIINTNFLYSKYFKNYFNKYSDNINIDYNISIINSVCDNIYNKNILNEYLKNFYIFKWNNIIFDDIELIKKIDKNNILNNLSTNIKYYLLNNNLNDITSNYIINNSIDYYNSNNKLSNNNLDLNNFYFFIKKELLISNKNIDINIIYVPLTISKDEKNIFDTLFEDNNDRKKMSLFLTNPLKYNFNKKNLETIYLINEKYYKVLIEKDNNKINNINNFFMNKKDNENYNSYINNYFNTNLFLEETENTINALIKNIEDNISQYNSKILYFKNIINEYSDKTYSCPICLENIEKENFCIINCGHYFCKNCISKYINEKENYYNCPNCRSHFSIDNVFIPIINENKIVNINSINSINSTKINKINEIIDIHTNNKIIIVTQYRDNIKIKEYLCKNIDYYILFYKNNYLKEKNRESFINNNNKSILFCNYDDLLKYTFNNVNSIIFIDYLEINNIFSKIKKDYLEKNIDDINVIFYLLYFKDTFEESIINKYI